ncbi:hypothetical protein LXA43DRAFT_254502 [Ganoderma leucocontextum]|nr:hypothetical protein LXA43DRAFT_254502 [Ganoderma leucocontextum]
MVRTRETSPRERRRRGWRPTLVLGSGHSQPRIPIARTTDCPASPSIRKPRSPCICPHPVATTPSPSSAQRKPLMSNTIPANHPLLRSHLPNIAFQRGACKHSARAIQYSALASATMSSRTAHTASGAARRTSVPGIVCDCRLVPVYIYNKSMRFHLQFSKAALSQSCAKYSASYSCTPPRSTGSSCPSHSNSLTRPGLVEAADPRPSNNHAMW